MLYFCQAFLPLSCNTKAIYDDSAYLMVYNSSSMNTQEENYFIPLTEEDKPVAINKQMFVVATEAQDSDYINQIAEPYGFNTCLPTSVLNGLIHQGYIARDQAQAVQEDLVKKYKHFFGQLRFGDKTILVWRVPTLKIGNILFDEWRLNVEFKVENVKGLDQEGRQKFLKAKLQEGNVLVGSVNNDHAMLFVGYDKQKDALLCRDPLKPQVLTSIPTAIIAMALKPTDGDPYLTVIPKPITS